MKKIFLLLFIVTNAFAQSEKASIGINIVPAILNKTVDLQTEFRLDSTKSITANLGFTLNNKGTYEYCFQCAGMYSKYIDFDAYALKLNYRKYYKNKRRNQKFYAFGAVVAYDQKVYQAGFALFPPDFVNLPNDFSRKRFVFSPNFQLGRSLYLGKSINMDFGTQLNFPVQYKTTKVVTSNPNYDVRITEPRQYTPTRGATMINFFMILKLKT